MGSRRACLLFGLVLVVGLLAFAGGAAGDTTSSGSALVVGTTQSPDVTLVEFVSTDNGIMANLELDIPAGYVLDPPVPGTKLADTVFITRAGQFGTGVLTVADPAIFTDPAVLACDTQTHVAVWSMTVVGTTINVPWFVDAGANGGYAVHVCLPAAQFGSGAGALQIAALITEFDGTLHAPAAPGSYVWHAFVTPFAADGQTLDPAGLVDFQAVVPLPVTLTMKTTYNPQTKFANASGKLLFAGQPASGYTIDFSAAKTEDGDPADVGTAQVNTDGSFSYPVYTTQSEYLFADPEIAESTCTSANTAASACISTEFPLVEAASHVIVTKPKQVVKKPVKKKPVPKCKKGQKSTTKHRCHK